MRRIIFSALLGACFCSAFAQTKVVAHRGYWNVEGSAQNSFMALQKAGEIGCWGSEFDVWITADGVCVVNHDSTVDGKQIEKVNYAELRDVRLKNGECLPTLEEYLWKAGHYAPMKLVLEVKPHSSKDADSRCVGEVLRLVKKYCMVDETEYISFSMHACECLVANGAKVLNGPNGQRSGKRVDKVEMKVAYLGGDVAPADIKAKGLTGIDYEQSILLDKHPEWIQQAHELGLTVNVWTVDNLNNVWKLYQNGVDFITTNRPVESLKLTK